MINYKTWNNLAAMFFDVAGAHGEKPFLWAKRDGAWRSISFADAIRQVHALARGLESLGVKHGDRVAIVSENRPEWPIADLAIMTIGAITVPAYITNTEADHHHILSNSGAKGVIVSTKKLAERVLPAAHRVDATQFVIGIEPPARSQRLNVQVHTWDDILAKGATGPDVVARALTWARTSTACIIYTSGTGGAPKGVMLSHGAILHNCAGAHDALLELGLGDEVFLSFLPLSHSYEHTAGQFFPISIGAQIYYAQGADTLLADMADARPTIMTAVPRLYETIHARMSRAIKADGGLKEKLFAKAVELGRKRMAGQRLSFGERIVDVIVDKLVRNKIRARFGGRLKALVSGGAPLNPDIGSFFTALGLCLLQGYGLTESAPVISVNRPRKVKIATVGPALLDVEVRLADDGEILVRGELLMQGYWKNPEATREAIRDGWLHTGDIGVRDADGYIQITDRKKDIIVNSGGDNLSPQRVEGILTLEPEIAQAMVYGDRRPYLVALIVPDQVWLDEWAKEKGQAPDLKALAADRELQAALRPVIDRVNRGLSSLETVRRYIVATEPFSVDNGQMTPTMKVRRHKVRETYGKALDALYA